MLDIRTEADSRKGALFPRVHVSETRVPGPRAPPRNKMAIFEQFTIPRHRFVPPLVKENSHKVNSNSGSGFVKPKQVKLRQVSSKESDVSCGKAKCEALRCSISTSKSSAACDSENHSINSAGVSHGNGIANTELLVGSAASSGRSTGISQTNEAHVAKTSLPVETVADQCIHECNGANGTISLVQQIVCSDSSEVAGSIGKQEHDVDRWNSDFLPRIIPKHVIGVIGQREFWEARKTMLQQQKTLSMQVFELHRLIEVQRLIAAMPGLLLEGKGKCFVVKGSLQPELAKVSNKLVTKESLNREAKHRSKQKQMVVKEPKKLMKLSCGVSNTTVNDKCQNPSLQVLPLKPVSHDHTGGFIPTPFIENQWLKAGSHNYGFCRGPMAFAPPILGHWYNGHQVLQSGSYVFTDWSRPCDFLPKDIPEVYNPPVASQELGSGNLIHHLDHAPGARGSESIPIAKTTSVLRKSSYYTLNPPSSAQHSESIRISQKESCTIERQQSSDCSKRASRSTKWTGDLYMPDKMMSMSLAGSCEFRSERSGLGFHTFHKMVSTRGNESDTIAQTAKVKDMLSVTESCVVQKNDRVVTSKVIRAVPHPASAAVQAAAKILKSIQQSESSKGMVHD